MLYRSKIKPVPGKKTIWGNFIPQFFQGYAGADGPIAIQKSFERT
jgi:hypothetical protein